MWFKSQLSNLLVIISWASFLTSLNFTFLMLNWSLNEVRIYNSSPLPVVSGTDSQLLSENITIVQGGIKRGIKIF
jgi:hypothetical protein